LIEEKARSIKNYTGNLGEEAKNIHLISDTIGMEFTSLEFVKEIMVHNQYIRFPPVYEGKLGIKK